MYGTETLRSTLSLSAQFENDVKMYGTETIADLRTDLSQFENDVKMYGTETVEIIQWSALGLRMM